MGPRTSLRQFIIAARDQFTLLVRGTVASLETRRPFQLIAVLLISCVVGGYVAMITNDATAHRQSWTAHRTVLVSTVAIGAGESVSPANSQLVDLPRAIIPDDAVASVSDGARLRISVTRRTALTASMLESVAPVVAIPDGWRGVAMPSDLDAPSLVMGSRVDVVAGSTVVAADAIVLTVGPDAPLTIAVPADSAPLVASAVRLGEVSLILSS